MNINLYMDAISGGKSHSELVSLYQDMIQNIFMKDSKDQLELVLVHSELKDKFKIDKKDHIIDTYSICGVEPLRDSIYMNTIQIATKSWYMDSEDFIKKYEINDVLRGKVDIDTYSKNINQKSFIERNFSKEIAYALYMVSKAYLYSKDNLEDIGEFMIKHLKYIVSEIVSEMKFLDMEDRPYIKGSSSLFNQGASKESMKELILLIMCHYTVDALHILHKYLNKSIHAVHESVERAILKVIIYDDIYYHNNISLIGTILDNDCSLAMKRAYSVKNIKEFIEIMKIKNKLKYHNKHFNKKYGDFLLWKYIEESMEYVTDKDGEIGDILIQRGMLYGLYKNDSGIIKQLIRLDKLFSNVFIRIDTDLNRSFTRESMLKSAENMTNKCKNLYR